MAEVIDAWGMQKRANSARPDWRRSYLALLTSNASGFGSLLVRTTIRHQLGGEIVREMRREGVHIRLAIPLNSLAEKEGP